MQSSALRSFRTGASFPVAGLTRSSSGALSRRVRGDLAESSNERAARGVRCTFVMILLRRRLSGRAARRVWVEPNTLCVDLATGKWRRR